MTIPSLQYKMYSYLRAPTESELEYLNSLSLERWKEVALHTPDDINGLHRELNEWASLI